MDQFFGLFSRGEIFHILDLVNSVKKRYTFYR